MNIKETRAVRKERMGRLMTAVLDQLRQAKEPVWLQDLAAATSPTAPEFSQSHYVSTVRAVGSLVKRCQVALDMPHHSGGRIVARLASYPPPAGLMVPLDGATVDEAILAVLADAERINTAQSIRIFDRRCLPMSVLNGKVVNRLARDRRDVPKVRAALYRSLRRLSARGLIRRVLDPLTGNTIVMPDGVNVD